MLDLRDGLATNLLDKVTAASARARVEDDVAALAGVEAVGLVAQAD